jgi:hypothetical protein
LRSTIVIFVLTFAVLGLLLGYAASYNEASESILQLTTNKPEYSSGEVVTFTAKNTGSETLVFPDSALGISIMNLDSGDSYSIIAAQVLTPIEPGESRQVVWQDAATAGAGNYAATITTAGGFPVVSAEVKFKII